MRRPTGTKLKPVNFRLNVDLLEEFEKTVERLKEKYVIRNMAHAVEQAFRDWIQKHAQD